MLVQLLVLLLVPIQLFDQMIKWVLLLMLLL